MEEVTDLLHVLIRTMNNIESTLEEISRKLDNLDGTHSLDDVVAAVETATDDIVGSTRYNLTDLHGELTSITSELSGINSTLMLKD